MSRQQVQEAYIVAATRSPIGKAPRGMFRNTRPDDLLVAVIKSALAQVPSLDPKAIEDAVIPFRTTEYLREQHEQTTY